jgi:hypothetical protein
MTPLCDNFKTLAGDPELIEVRKLKIKHVLNIFNFNDNTYNTINFIRKITLHKCT